MSFKQALSTAPQRGKQCRYEEWLKTLDTEDRAAVEEAILGTDWSIEKLLKALREEGAPVYYEMIRRHRNRTCRICSQ